MATTHSRRESRADRGGSQRVDAARNILAERRPAIDCMLAPKSVAVIGATEHQGGVGRTLMENLRCFAGPVYPINPKRAEVMGVKAFPSIADVPGEVDLAVIATPAATVPSIIGACAARGVKGAVVISAGFKETGPDGVRLEQEILANRGGMRIVGPNCLGVMNPHAGLNATFASGMARPGSVGFISQSGALCTAVLDWSFAENVGFSAFISIGSMLDVGWGDLIYHLGDDPYTKSIIVYMESIGDARAFLSAAREVSLTKPIIAIKIGRTEAGAKAAASHTGSLTGSDEVLDAAFRRAGVLRVQSIADLFYMAEVLGKQPRPRGPRLAIVTNAGGPAGLASDMLVSNGGKIAALSGESMKVFNDLLPAHWSHNNPVDILGDASAERYAKAVEIAARDENNDGVLVILTPQAMTECTATAEKLKPFAKLDGKPILASWMGGRDIAAGEAVLNEADIPTFRFPDTAARAFCYMWNYSDNLRALYETPAPVVGSDDVTARRAAADRILGGARSGKRTILTETESKNLLSAYGIPTVETHIAHTAGDAGKIAAKIGCPVVLKLHSETITHKTDVGGVKLNLGNAAAVAAAFAEIKKSVKEKASPGCFQGVSVQPMIARRGHELILGSSTDPQFGPVLLFGAGGQFVEVFKDRALGLPPLNATLALRMIEQTRVYAALQGVRGEKGVDLAALGNLLVRFSELVLDQPSIKEIDINPLLASSTQILALDARVVLHEAGVDYPRPAIRPYPAQYAAPSKMADGTAVTIRPIRPEDEPLMVKFHGTLSEESVHYRYFGALHLSQRVAHERLTRICFNDYDRELALVVECRTGRGAHEILGVGRLSKQHACEEAEFAIVIGDAWQGCGLGTQLLKQLVEIGRQEKLKRITAHILPDNAGMRHVAKKAGFKIHRDLDEGECIAEIHL